MKKAVRRLILILAIVGVGVCMNLLYAQPQPNDPSIGGGNVGSGPIGGSAPLGGGIVMLLVMGAGYAAKKIYDARKSPLSE